MVLVYVEDIESQQILVDQVQPLRRGSAARVRARATLYWGQVSEWLVMPVGN